MAHRLAKANIITKKNLVPEDKPEDWDHPSGLRIGTIEVTRLGMNEKDMEPSQTYRPRFDKQRRPRISWKRCR